MIEAFFHAESLLENVLAEPDLPQGKCLFIADARPDNNRLQWILSAGVPAVETNSFDNRFIGIEALDSTLVPSEEFSTFGSATRVAIVNIAIAVHTQWLENQNMWFTLKRLSWKIGGIAGQYNSLKDSSDFNNECSLTPKIYNLKPEDIDPTRLLYVEEYGQEGISVEEDLSAGGGFQIGYAVRSFNFTLEFT